MLLLLFFIFGFLLSNLPNGTLVGWVHLFVERAAEIGSELGHVCKGAANTETRRGMLTSQDAQFQAFRSGFLAPNVGSTDPKQLTHAIRTKVTITNN